MIRCFSSDIRAHLAKVGEYLRDCRANRDKRLVDVRVMGHGITDFLHSSVGAAHSQLIRKMIETQTPPYDVNMTEYAGPAVVKVIDWMYFGEIDLVVREMGEYLAVSAAMGIDQLHEQLEVRLQQCAIRAEFRVPAINIATEPRHRVSSVTVNRLVKLIANENDALCSSDRMQLTPRSVGALVFHEEIAFMHKVNLFNMAVQWLKVPSHVQLTEPILGSVRVPQVSAEELNTVIREVRDRLLSANPRYRQAVYVYSSDGKRLMVGGDLDMFAKSSQVLVPPCTSPASSASSQVGREHVTETRTKQRTVTQVETTVRSPASHLKKKQEKDLKLTNGRWGLPHENLYRPTQKGSQELINARQFPPEEKAENEALPDLIGRHLRQRKSISQDEKLSRDGARSQRSTETLSRSAFGAESIAEINDHPNNFNGSHPRVFGKESITEINGHPDYFIAKVVPHPSRSAETINRHAFSPESIADINSHPNDFKPKGSHRRVFGSDSIAEINAHPNNFITKVVPHPSRSTETINRHAFSPESIAAINSHPNDFKQKGSHNRVFGADSIADINAHPECFSRNGARPARSTETINRHAFSPESIADINSHPGNFDRKDNNNNGPMRGGPVGPFRAQPIYMGNAGNPLMTSAGPYQTQPMHPGNNTTGIHPSGPHQTQPMHLQSNTPALLPVGPFQSQPMHMQHNAPGMAPLGPYQMRPMHMQNFAPVWAGPQMNSYGAHPQAALPPHLQTHSFGPAGAPLHPYYGARHPNMGDGTGTTMTGQRQALLPVGPFQSQPMHMQHNAPVRSPANALTVNRRAFGAESVAEINAIPDQFVGRRRLRSIIDIRILPEHSASVGSHSQYTVGLPGIDTLRQIDSLPNFSQRSGRIRSASSRSIGTRSDLTLNKDAFGAESIVEMNNLPVAFEQRDRRRSVSSGSTRSDLTLNRNAFGPQSIADINSLPNTFEKSALYRRRSNSALNRGPMSAESVAEINAHPNQFDTDSGRSARQFFSKESISHINELPNQFHKNAMHRQRSQSTINKNAFGPESLADIKALPSPFDRRHGTDSETERSARLRHLHRTPSEIMELNAHPDFVSPNFVVGKRNIPREELEELRAIPPISGGKGKAPVVGRFDFSEDEIEDIRKLPDITGSQYLVGGRMRTKSELREIAQLPGFEDKTPKTQSGGMSNRPNDPRQ